MMALKKSKNVDFSDLFVGKYKYTLKTFFFYPKETNINIVLKKKKIQRIVEKILPTIVNLI